jgi:hypothetical protein
MAIPVLPAVVDANYRVNRTEYFWIGKQHCFLQQQVADAVQRTPPYQREGILALFFRPTFGE